MASSSTSFVQKSFRYDVFISFRGEDTRKTFVDHLYSALKDKGILSYKDDKEIRQGRKISNELMNSIENSKLYIIVFSKNYASSSWCLDELVKIMECQNAKDQIAYPVFYDVEPTQVRKQIGAVGEGFAKHVNAESAGKWRRALKEAADLAGLELKTTANGHEAEFIKQIVEKISLELPCSSPDENLIGMKSRVEDVVSSLEIGNDDVRVIGIKGMGGGGKTTLARAVFDRISHTFEGQSFVANVREISKASLNGLTSLQKQILTDVSKDQGITVNNVYDGRKMMQRIMPLRTVLLVLDDVDHIIQLEELAGEPKWCKPGSRIIITTRDEQVLQVLKVHGVKLTIRDVSLLSDQEAICLFSRYAFGSENPIQGHENVSEQVVHYAAGLPLTIRVLGSFLCGKVYHEWIDALERLKTIPLKETLEKLEISYIGLEDDYKEIFLDVACLLKGWNKEQAIRALESQGFNAAIGLRVLEQKSLISVSEYNCLNVHDHIEEMGKNIVRRVHPHEPWRHSRLWIEAEVKDILANDQGTKATRGIHIYTQEFDPNIFMRGLRNMEKLRFLYVGCHCYDFDAHCDKCSWKYDKCDQYFPNSLQYLWWDQLPIDCLPTPFLANNLVTLEMFGSNIVRLWEEGERKALNKLRHLNLASSKLVTFDFELIPNLETLDLQGCINMVAFHIPNGFPKLKFLDLTNSTLKILKLGPAPNLETLIVKGCHDLVELHIPFRCPKLKSIILESQKFKILDLGMISDLETLSIDECDLVKLHMPEKCLNLKYFNLNLYNLRNLTLGLSPYIDSLHLDACRNLVELSMPYRCPKLKSIVLASSKLKKLDLGVISDLETLILKGCDLVDLYMPEECPNLKYLSLGLSKLRNLTLGLTPNLESLSLDGCCDLVELQMPYRCPKLKSIVLASSKLNKLDLRLISDLETLSIEGCDLLDLHMPDECPNLKYLNLGLSKLRNFTLGLTPDLESLSLDGCCDLVQLQMPYRCPKLKSIVLASSKLNKLDLRLISDLEKLSLEGCDLLELYMPDECPNLKYLNLGLPKLRNLTLGLTPNLESISLDGCCDLVELDMPYSYPKLKCITLTCSKLDLCSCGRFESFFFDKSFQSFETGSLSGVRLVTESKDIYPYHLDNSSWNFRITDIYKEHPFPMYGNLEKVMSISLGAWTVQSYTINVCHLRYIKKLTLEGNISKAPKDLDQLQRLEELIFSTKEIINLPDSLCRLKQLKSLHFKSCWLIEKLPEDLGLLECLEELIITDCKLLQGIPNSIRKMEHLEYLHLPNCVLVESLPEEIGHLESLKEINLEGTGVTKLPQSIFRLKGLRVFGSKCQLQSFEITSVKHTTMFGTFCVL